MKPTKPMDHVVDIVGVMFTGIDSDICTRARHAATQWGTGSEATILGVGQRIPTASAAFGRSRQ